MKKRIKKTSMQDIADHLNISKNAVALALNNKKGVSEELRDKILQTAVKLGYGGLGKVNGAQKNVLLIVPESATLRLSPYAAGHFYPDIIWAIERYAQQRNAVVVMSSLDKKKEAELALPQLYYGMNISGIILLGVFTQAYVDMVRRLEIPLVAVDNSYPRTYINSVVTANMEGGYEIASHLIGSGHRKIGFIGPVDRTSSNQERWIGYRNAMEEAGLPVLPEFCVTETRSDETNLTESEIKSYVNEVASLPDAWFCASDNMAIFLINALKDRGFSIPGDVSVAGFDDIAPAQHISPSLTTFHVKRTFMGETAVDLLLRSIEKGADDHASQIKVYGELKIRDSVKR